MSYCISQLGHPVVQKKKMENSKSYYFRILLELAFLKGAKMAAELCKSRSYSIVFQKMTNWTNIIYSSLEFMCESRYGPVCGAQGINLTLSVPTIVKSTGGSFLIKKNSMSLWYQFILPHNFTSIFSNLYNSTYHVHGV